MRPIDGEIFYDNSIFRKFKSDAIDKTVFFFFFLAEAKLKEMEKDNAR